MPSEKPPIPVHALDDTRIHLAPAQHGRLRQGRLKTFCGKLAVSELPLFAMAETKGRCPKCFALLEGGKPAEKMPEVAPSKPKRAPAAKKKAPAPASKPAASPKKRWG